MNDTMYQEAMLNSIETIDDVVLESEIQSLLSMYDVCVKEMLMVQEGVVLEAKMTTTEENLTADKLNSNEGNNAGTNESWLRKLIKLFKGLIEKFILKIKRLRTKILRKHAMKKLGINEKKGTIKIDCDFDTIISVLKEIDFYFRYMTGNEKGAEKKGMKLANTLKAAVEKTTTISIADFESKSDMIEKLLDSCKKNLAEIDMKLISDQLDVTEKTIESINQMEAAINIVIAAVGNAERKFWETLDKADTVDAKYDAA